MGDDITIGVTEIVNNIEVTAQPNDQVIDIDVIDNSDSVTLNVTPNIIEVNVERGSSFARWGTIYGSILDQTDLQNALFNKADLVNGLVPAYQLPSFVDDVIEVANFASLPTTGETGKLYLTLDNNKIYRWGGSTYVEIASNQAIWGQITGTLSNQTDLQNALNLKADKTITITPNAPLTGGGDLSANRTLSITQSGVSSDGYLSSSDWNTFNNKQNQLNGTGFVKASGTTISYDNTSYLPLSGGTMTGQIVLKESSSSTDYTKGLRFPNDPFGGGDDVSGIRLYSNSGENQVLEIYIKDNSGTDIINFATGSSGGLSNNDVKINGNTIWNVGNLPSPISGTGTTNFLPKFTSSGVIGNSQIFDNGSFVGIGVSSGLNRILQVVGTTPISHKHTSSPLEMIIGQFDSSGNSVINNTANADLYFHTNNTRAISIKPTARVGIGTSFPSARFQVTETGGSGSNTNCALFSDSVSNTLGISNANGVNTVFSQSLASTPLASDLAFATTTNAINGTPIERMRITSGGWVGINTTTPVDNLTINGGVRTLGTAAGYFFNNRGLSNVYGFYATGGTIFVFNDGVGNIASINTTSGVYVPLSDRNKKKDFEESTIGLDAILGLKPTLYRIKSDSNDAEKKLGFVAQEVEEFIPQAFIRQEGEKEDFIGLDYNSITAALVKAVQELKAEIDLLKQKA